MSAIFLSASVPQVGRGNYYETADPFLIQTAVRELVIATIREHTLVWGGHPSITPMIWAICEDLGVDYAQRVVLYQSRFFKVRFPEENQRFGNVVYVDAVKDDLQASLEAMRLEMLGRTDLAAAVFIGGMEGVEVEFDLFRDAHPQAAVLLVQSAGGAARQLAQKLQIGDDKALRDVDFATLYQETIVKLLESETPAADMGDVFFIDWPRTLGESDVQAADDGDEIQQQQQNPQLSRDSD